MTIGSETAKPRRRWHHATGRLIVWSLIAFLAVFEVLSFSNFCLAEKRFYSEAELIDIAIKMNMARGRGDKKYATVEEFRRENPNCCSLSYREPFVEVYGFTRLFGITHVAAHVYYKISDTAPEYKYYYSWVKLSSCGKILRTRGIQERSGP